MPKQNVPALRLHGFSGEWKTASIGAVSALHNGRDYKHLGEGCIPVYGTGGYMAAVDQALSHDKDAVGIGRKGTINKPYILKAPFWTVDTLFYVVPNQDTDLAFFYASVLRVDWMAKNTATGLPSLTSQAINSADISVPPTLEEQQAIGAIFTNLDAAINQHTLKHKALQQAKTALMQRMFPQEGQTVPELRLKGFSGEWEETTLGELGSTYGGLSGKKKEDFGHGDAMYVTYKDIFSRALITDTSQCERVEVDASQNEVRYGDIFFTTSSEIPEEVGLSAVWLIDKPNVYLNSFCFGFRPTGGFDLHFLGHVLRSPAVRSQFLLLAQGISRFNISKTKAANISLYAPPTLEEQQAIGAVFTNLDQLIAAEAQYIASLKQAKTALLQRMFI